MDARTPFPADATMKADSPVMLPITAVERETGVSKELLRMWERRYAFPTPERDDQGNRIYPPEQVDKLRLLRRLIDHGFRPGKLIGLERAELEELLRSRSRSPVDFPPLLQVELLEALRSREARRVRAYLTHQLVKMGLQAFVMDFLQYANQIVGDAWMRGNLEVFEEHLYTEQAQTLMREAIGKLRETDKRPRVMLTTPPDEQHTLGIVMVEALLRLDEIDAISYGAQMPTREIVHAVTRHHIDVVVMSFSASFPAARASEFLEELRFRLPAETAIWAGGSGLSSTRRHVEGVAIIHDLAGVRAAAQHWQQRKVRR